MVEPPASACLDCYGNHKRGTIRIPITMFHLLALLISKGVWSHVTYSIHYIESIGASSDLYIIRTIATTIRIMITLVNIMNIKKNYQHKPGQKTTI